MLFAIVFRGSNFTGLSNLAFAGVVFGLSCAMS